MFCSRYPSSAARPLLLTLLCGVLLFLLPACEGTKRLPDAPVRYQIVPQENNNADIDVVNYLKKHLQKRSASYNILSEEAGNGVRRVTLHLDPALDGDYQVHHEGENVALTTKDRRTMVWLMYQFIKYAAQDADYIQADELPPCIFPTSDTLARFPFAYRDIHMPSNQNPDMTEVLGLNNLEIDWAIWGHQMSRVLGTVDDDAAPYQNLDQELFARTGGRVHKDQFCFSSDRLYDLTEQFIESQYGEGNQQPWRFTIGPNDNSIVCLCARCVEAGNTPGNATPAVTEFIRRLSARFPRHQFFIPGYSTTKAVPEQRLPSNVGVFLSAIDYPRSWNDRDSKDAEEFFETLEQWKKVTDTIYIWDYICNFDDYLSPYPILLVMQQRFKEYIAHGVEGIFLNGSGYFYSSLQEMYSFVLADLLVNPDLDPFKLMDAYFADAMPHIGMFFAKVLQNMELHAMRAGTKLPLYGGIDEALSNYLFEKEFREQYGLFLQLEDHEMTHRERVIFEKTRQNVAFSYLEICRLHGLSKGGFAELKDGRWEVRPEVWVALEDLNQITPEEDVYLLTSNENASPDHMDRINENGVYLADYENECALWLHSEMWNKSLITGQPLILHIEDDRTWPTKRLTDGVAGISQNYHWGWYVMRHKEITIEIPTENLTVPTVISLCVLNSNRHKIAPPQDIAVVVDDQVITHMKRQTIGDYFDEGEKIAYSARIGAVAGSKLELSITKVPNAPIIAIDEINLVPTQ